MYLFVFVGCGWWIIIDYEWRRWRIWCGQLAYDCTWYIPLGQQILQKTNVLLLCDLMASLQCSQEEPHCRRWMTILRTSILVLLVFFNRILKIHKISIFIYSIINPVTLRKNNNTTDTGYTIYIATLLSFDSKLFIFMECDNLASMRARTSAHCTLFLAFVTRSPTCFLLTTQTNPF